MTTDSEPLTMNSSYHAMALYSLNIADPPAALKEAEKILTDYEHSSPVGVARAADIVLMSARLKSEAEATHLFAQIEPILKNTLARMRGADPGNIDRSTSVTLLHLLGFGYQFLGQARLALRHARAPPPDIRSLRRMPKTVRTCARHWRLCCHGE